MRFLAFASAAIVASTIGALAQQPEPAQQPGQSKPPKCFFVTQFDNWKAPDANTMYIRVNMNKYYRLEMSNSCPALTWPDAHLIMHIRGANTICSPLDWDLKVSQGIHDIPMPCIVKSMTPLSADEVAAIPKKFKP
ncbi:MAG TPA: DUF6491 family protein [Rhizomicrobium sp.]|nr:DUF6491 family protein [Rhizomicrobium sp.]